MFILFCSLYIFNYNRGNKYGLVFERVHGVSDNALKRCDTWGYVGGDLDDNSHQSYRVTDRPAAFTQPSNSDMQQDVEFNFCEPRAITYAKMWPLHKFHEFQSGVLQRYQTGEGWVTVAEGAPVEVDTKFPGEVKVEASDVTVSGISYELATATVGAHFHIDRTYAFNEVDPALEGAILIKTPHDFPTGATVVVDVPDKTYTLYAAMMASLSDRHAGYHGNLPGHWTVSDKKLVSPWGDFHVYESTQMGRVELPVTTRDGIVTFIVSGNTPLNLANAWEMKVDTSSPTLITANRWRIHNWRTVGNQRVDGIDLNMKTCSEKFSGLTCEQDCSSTVTCTTQQELNDFTWGDKNGLTFKRVCL